MKENLQITSEILEEMFIVNAINNKSFFLKIKPYIQTKSKKKSYFSDQKNQIIFNLVSLWYDKYSKFPSLQELKFLLEKINEDEEIKSLLNGMATKYYSQSVKNYNQIFLEEEAQKFIQESRVYEAMALSQADIEAENYSVIVDRMKNAVNVNFDKDLGISIRDVDKIFELFNQTQTAAISTGIPKLDVKFEGGWRAGEITCLAGVSSVGKSLLLGCFAINAFMSGKKVLVYSFETGKERLAARYYTNIASKNKADLFNDETASKEKLKANFEMSEGDIVIKEYPANAVSSNDLLVHLNDLEMYNNWKPDLIVADYLLIMNTNDRRLDPGDSYKYYKTVTEELRNVAKAYSVPILTAVQINREGMGEGGGSKAITTSKNIAESAGIFHTVDAFITINQTVKDKEKNKLMLFLEKNRNEEGHVKIQCTVDYNLMRIEQSKEEVRS